MDDLDFIINFSKIKITDICREHNISRGNIYNRTLGKEKARIIRTAIEDKIHRLYIKGDSNEIWL